MKSIHVNIIPEFHNYLSLHPKLVKSCCLKLVKKVPDLIENKSTLPIGPVILYPENKQGFSMGPIILSYENTYSDYNNFNDENKGNFDLIYSLFSMNSIVGKHFNNCIHIFDYMMKKEGKLLIIESSDNKNNIHYISRDLANTSKWSNFFTNSKELNNFDDYSRSLNLIKGSCFVFKYIKRFQIDNSELKEIIGHSSLECRLLEKEDQIKFTDELCDILKKENVLSPDMDNWILKHELSEYSKYKNDNNSLFFTSLPGFCF